MSTGDVDQIRALVLCDLPVTDEEAPQIGT